METRTPPSVAPKRRAGPGHGPGDRRALDRVDGARGQREGRATVERRRRARTRRMLVGGLAAAVLGLGVLFAAVFPLQSYRSQREATAAAEAELRDLRAERARVNREADLLETPGEIERRARQEFGYKLPGEETYNILPAPTDPLGLPEIWPFAGVERALGGRS